jgi:hypothetical protein
MGCLQCGHAKAKKAASPGVGAGGLAWGGGGTAAGEPTVKMDLQVGQRTRWPADSAAT